MNQNQKSFRRLFSIIFLTIFVSLACQIPFNEPEQNVPETNLEATLSALQTQVAETESEKSTTQVVPTSESTLVSEATETEQIQQPDQPTQIYKYKGVYLLQNNWFSPFDFSGKSIGNGFPAGANTWYGDNDVESFTDEIFYTEFMGGPTSVYRVNSQGTTTLDFINSQDPISSTSSCSSSSSSLCSSSASVRLSNPAEASMMS